MEEVIKHLVQANLQQQKAHTDSLQAQQETNKLLIQQMAVLTDAVRTRESLPPPPPNDYHCVRRTVREALQKMTLEDDIEAFLTVFERVAERGKLPADQWAEVLAPYLTGEPQKPYYDLALQDAKEYPKLKAEILGTAGCYLGSKGPEGTILGL